MADAGCAQVEHCPDGHAIIAGFGLPGREVAHVMQLRGLPFCVIETNPATVERCQIAGMQIIEGDVAQEQTLLRAGIAKARLLVLAVPNEAVVLAAVKLARRLNPAVRIIARCHYTSAGMLARQHGAEAVVVAEQVVAEELKGLVWDRLETPAP
jgi:CPA2 family monovalent cation:H+ antiporter-2